MKTISNRRVATRTTTSSWLLALAVAAGLSVIPLAEAQAQHSGHQGHQGHGAGKPPTARKAQPKGRPQSASPSRRSDAGAHHAGHGMAAADAPAVTEFKEAHATMMRGMEVPYTGDPDADFRIQMIPHHQGAIDMARVAMRHAKDGWTRQFAEAVIVEQQREIAEMQAWLARRGIAAPRVEGPQHTITASSYRQHDEEPGTRDEARGQSWAPGAGVPAAR